MKKQAVVATVLICSFAAWGVLEALADNRFTKLGATLSFLHVVFISGFVFWWATLDSARRSQRLSGGWTAALVLLGIASVPFYLCTNRPPERRWMSIAKGFGLLGVAVVLYGTTYVFTSVYDG